MKKKICFIIIICLTLALGAQQRMGPPPGEYNFTGENGFIEIPFELVLDHIVITAILNGENPVNLVLDTGMPAHGAMLYETENIKELNLHYSGQAMVGGPGGDLKPANILMGASLKFPGLEFTGLDIVVLPEDENSRKRFSHHNGVIGYSFFSRFVIEIDFVKSVIKVFQPESFTYTGKGKKLEIELSRNTPVVPCSSVLSDGTLVNQEMVVDLGSTGAVSLNLNQDKQVIPPAVNLAGKAYGVSGGIDIRTARINKITIGDYSLENVLATFTESGFTGMPDEKFDGLLGIEILKRFDLIIDYLNKQIYLEPNSLFSLPFEMNMSGIRFFRDNDRNMVIEEILADSPASEAGLSAGDIITEINGQKLNDISENDLQKMLKQENERLELKLIREDSIISKSIKLRRLI